MRRVCRGCGTREAEWQENPDAYVGDIRYCPGCARLEAERDNMPDSPNERRGMTPRLVALEYAREQAKKLADADRPRSRK